MNILFLDDLNRTKTFLSRHPDATVVETAAECIFQLAGGEWDLVMLDHDLGGEQYVNSDLPNTGMEVARWIAANKPEIGEIIVHSLNRPAATRMLQELAGYTCVYYPFAWNKI